MEPDVLPKPTTPLPANPPKKETKLENISLSTIPQVIDFRKAFAFFSSARFRFKIIYDELLQFDRFLNQENTKILSKLLKDLEKTFKEFVKKFFYINDDGEMQQLNITGAANYGNKFVETLSLNVNSIFQIFDEYYNNFDNLVSEAQNNPII